MCSECGQPHSESTHPDSEFAYEAEIIRCHACHASARAASAYQDKGGDMAGVQIHLEKRPTEQ